MPTTSIIKNRERFISESLDVEHGEKILVGAADGEAVIINCYEKFLANQSNSEPKPHMMSLIPTNKRIVVYEAKGWLSKDRFSQIAKKDLKRLSFIAASKQNGGKQPEIALVTEFVTDDSAKSPTIVFKLTVRTKDEFNAYRKILSAISHQFKVEITDYTDYDKMKAAFRKTAPAKKRKANQGKKVSVRAIREGQR